ncbi:MAG: hypothetical protein H0X45_10680 [Planctomycetes bacterium]|nr:hypothetical protein [Planctomycetota bacterium]
MDTWPIAGLAEFARRPRLWLAPLIAGALGWSLVISTGIAIGWWQWPGPAVGWWATTVATVEMLGLAVLGALTVWLLVLPPLMGLACERLAKAVQRDAGAPPADEEPLMRSLLSSLRVVVSTLPLRLAWLAASLVAWVVGGPVGLVVSALAVAHVGLIDACDTGLAMRGLDGRARLIALRAHRGELRRALPVAAAMQVSLAVTIVGIVFFLPGLVTGAARRVLGWAEAMNRFEAEKRTPDRV